MPNRMIRESCRTSLTLDALSDGAERTFWRLTTVADDYGRFEADPRIVTSTCYPLRNGRLDADQVKTWLDEMLDAGLIQVYRAGEKVYGVFLTWGKHQHVRAKRSKYPAPPTSVSICQQMLTDVPVVEVEDEDGVEDEVEGGAGRLPSGRQRPGRRKRPPGQITPTWRAYATAYAQRYGVEPKANAALMGKLAQFFDKIGAEEAPVVAGHYVQSNFALYVRSGHAVDLLVRDAEKLRTEWFTGQRITETQARRADQTQERGSIARRLLAEAEAQARESRDRESPQRDAGTDPHGTQRNGHANHGRALEPVRTGCRAPRVGPLSDRTPSADVSG